jgi:NAD(P)H-hydrate epimerase
LKGLSLVSVPHLYKAKDVRELDRIVIEKFSVPGYTLMQRAGGAAFAWLQKCWPYNKKITVICGSGNNAGDGYVVARLAHEAGYQSRVVSLVNFESLHGDALTAARAAADAGVNLIHCDHLNGEAHLSSSELLVDAIFGTGLDRPVEGKWFDAIQAINKSGLPVLALDIPSGLNANSGSVFGIAVKADCTVSFIALKQGLFTGMGRYYSGQVHLAELGVSSEAYRQVAASARLVHFSDIASELLKPRHVCAHKGEYGHVLLAGGDAGMSGALRLAGEAAIRCGAGLVSLATRQQHAALLSIDRPELMSHGVERSAQLKPLTAKASVIGVGPGLGRSDWGRAMFAALLECDQPMVVDADALNLLAGESYKKNNWVLTPHPGEAARLLGVSASEIERDRFAAVRTLQQRYGGVVVLKGAGTLIAYGEQELIDICGDGNPGMAVGGMGDVLTGVLAGLIAQKIPFEQACLLGVCLHSTAADCAAKQGQRGLLASDLFPYFRSLINP